MKKSFFTLIILLAFGSALLSQTTPANPPPKTEQPKTEEIKWYNWNDGYPKALSSGKILLIDIYTDWCGWCKKMDKDAYAKKDVIDLMNKHFIAVKFNPEKTAFIYDLDGKKLSSWDLYAQLVSGQRTGYPTTVFLYTKEKKIYLEAGYKDEAGMKQMLNKYIGLK